MLRDGRLWLAHAVALCLSGLMLAGCGGGATPSARQIAVPKAEPKVSAAKAGETPGLYLYEVERSGNRSHLMGTIHMGFGFEEVLTSDAERRFLASRSVMMEMEAKPQDGARLAQAAQLPAGESLRARLGPKTWEMLAARFAGTIPERVLDRLKPWMPAVMLGVAELELVIAKRRPGGDSHRMDVELMEAARAQGKPVLFLETIDQQIDIFESIPEPEQIRELTQSLSQDSSEQAEQLLDAFAAGDEAQLEEALFNDQELSDAPGFFEAVLFARNDRWLPVIEREHASGGVFVAVGAGHLLGERGLIRALRDRGYQVRRVGP